MVLALPTVTAVRAEPAGDVAATYAHAMSRPARRRVDIVPHTHWDREW
jgi:hypothetical protein